MTTNKPPAFQFYADDFVAGVADMTQAEVGAYILLLCHQWSRGEIPPDPDRAKLLAKGEVSPHVMAKFPAGKNQRLERVRAEQDAYRANRSESGKAGANKRWHSHSTANGTAIAQPMANGMANDSSPSPSPTPNKKKTASPQLTDEQWMETLKSNPAYSGIDVVREHGKAIAWCDTNRRQCTRRFFINWLNRAEKPLAPKPVNPYQPTCFPTAATGRRHPVSF